jgi:hypothetical protein
MKSERGEIVLRIPRKVAIGSIAVALAGLGVLLGVPSSRAQKSQESYEKKFDITEETAGVSVATSADGKYVYVVGPKGIMMSEDHGRTGSWVQTVRLK